MKSSGIWPLLYLSLIKVVSHKAFRINDFKISCIKSKASNGEGNIKYITKETRVFRFPQHWSVGLQ